MEPIAAQNHPISIRPAGPGGHSVELSQLLRDGRVLAGEVLQTLSDGAILIGIGRHKVPAQTHLRMDPGHHFLFQVQSAAGQILLRVLGAAGGEGSEFWRYLREVIGQGRPLGELLGELASRVRAELERPGGELDALRRLLAGLDGRMRAPGRGPEAGAELRELFRSVGLRYEALLFATLAGGLQRDALDALGRDLKGELLRALRDLPEGPLKEAVARALAGVEAEQLLNVARAHSGEPQVLSLPLPDGEGWTTARLAVPPRRERQKGGDGEPTEGDEDEPLRYALGLTLSRTGPIRADLQWSRDVLAVRLLAEHPDVVERLRADAPELAALLGGGERSVRITVGLGGPADLAVGADLNDITLLRDNHIMDVSG
jgi:hypothetical protein